MTAATPSRGKGLARAFARDATGVAAVEFAIILPVALLMMALVVYGGQLYRAQRKVSLAAATVANLVAQGGDTSASTLSSAEMSQMLAYPNLILYPINPTALQVVVSELSVSGASHGAAVGTVVWSRANGNATVRPTGQQLAVDVNVAAAFAGGAGGNAILAEVRLPFQPYDLFGSVSAMTLHDSALMIPRTATGVILQ